MAGETNWIEDLLGQRLYQDGTELLPTKKRWNFIGGLNAVYNTATGMVDIALGGGGFDWQESVRVGSAAPFVATRVVNTLTANGNGNINTLGGIDGINTLALDDRVLMQDQAAGADNGIYVITDLGTAGTPWIMERDVLADETGEITPGLNVVVEEGTVNGQRKFQCSNTGVITMNATAITFVFAGSTALVTAVFDGTVNSLGAANTVLQTDGATPGAEWRAALSLGATVATVGDIRLADQGAIVGWGTGPANVSMLNKDGADNVVLGGTFLANRPASIFIEPTTATIIRVGATQQLGVVAGALEVGTTATVAGAGDLRMIDTFSMQAWGTGPVDVPILAKAADDDLSIGLGSVAGANPPDIRYGCNSKHTFYANSNGLFVLVSGVAEFFTPVVRFDSTVAAPSVMQEVDATAGVAADLLTLKAQIASGTGATSGGSILVSAGDATGADANTGGSADMQAGTGGVHGGSVDGDASLRTAAGADRVTVTGTDGNVDVDSIDSAHWTAAGYARLGLVAGSGAGSTAAAGTVRLQDDGSIAWRNAADTVDIAAIVMDGADGLQISSVSQAHWVAAGYARFGLVAGSGAGSAAAGGTVRLQDDFIFSFRNAADTNDVTAMAASGADILLIGTATAGLRPGQITVDPQTAFAVNLGGVNKINLLAAQTTLGTALEISGTVFQFVTAVAAPFITHELDATASVVCDTLTVEAQGASNAVGGASAGTSGALLLRGGRGTIHVDNTDGNVALHEVPANWQSGEEIAFIGDAVTAPTAAPAAGQFLMSNAGALASSGPGGAITTISPAGSTSSVLREIVAEGGQSAGGGAVNLINRTMSNDQVAHVHAVCVARDTVNGDSASYSMDGTFEQTAGALVLIAQTPIHTGEEDAAWTCVLQVGGAQDIEVLCTGDGANATDWEVWAEIVIGF